MTLRDVRIEFIKRCGRYDLVTTDEDDEWGDNGANFYIQSGQRFLDKQGDFDTGQIGVFYGGLEKDESHLLVEDCWSIHEVYWRMARWPKHLWAIVSSVHSRKSLRCHFPTEPIYYQEPIRVLPSLDSLDMPASSIDLSSSASLDNIRAMKLHFIGFPKDTVHLKILGHFLSKELKEDTDANYWTKYHPEILLKATMYELEVFYRNSEGANDWLSALQVDLLDLHHSELFNSIMAQPAEMGL